jgi:hypothetical protein
MHAAATSKVENSAQGSSCKLKFVHDPYDVDSTNVSLITKEKIEQMRQNFLVTPPAVFKTRCNIDCGLFKPHFHWQSLSIDI